MREQVIRFAESYQAAMGRLSMRSHAAARHPSLFVFLAEDGEIFNKVQAAAQDMYQYNSGTFFLRLFPAEDNLLTPPVTDVALMEAGHAIRAIKADIQRNEKQLNIQKVNIALIVSSAMPVKNLTEIAGLLLRDIFAEDFPIVHMTLFILFFESTYQNDFEKNAALSMRLLREAEHFQQASYEAIKMLRVARDGRKQTVQWRGPLFDLACILSDRNENNIISTENMDTNYKIISSLPTIANTPSNFEESLRNKSIGKAPVFMTAGMARLVKPHQAIASAVFRHVFSYMMLALQENADRISQTEAQESVALLTTHPALRQADTDQVSEEKVIADIFSVAAKTVKSKFLHNKTLQTAEYALYGDACARFFAANYGTARLEAAYITAAEIILSDIRRFIETAGLYAACVYENNPLRDTLYAREQQAAQYEKDIASRYAVLYKHTVFQKIEVAKRCVAEIYAVRYRLEKLRAEIKGLQVLQTGLNRLIRQCEQQAKALARAYAELEQIRDSGQHIDEYYRQVVKTIMDELTNQHGTLFFHTPVFVGPFFTLPPDEPQQAQADEMSDITRLTARIIQFIQQYIFPHELLSLSFDEDLHQRSLMAPAAYDSAYTHIDDFYRHMLSEADRQAALAVSLQRYDDLIYEKYYFGDLNGTFMRYVQQLAQTAVHEAVYFLDEASGFKVIRLAGGFVIENLSRYRILQTHYAAYQDILEAENEITFSPKDDRTGGTGNDGS